MSEKFNPRLHLISLKGKDYLETKYRIQWFREDHPDGSILTEVINYDPVLVKATVMANGIVLATGHAGAKDAAGAVWSGRSVEKAETAATGRALGAAGYGTQFSYDEDNTDGNLADSPVERKNAPQTHTNGATARTQAHRDQLAGKGENGGSRRVGGEPERDKDGFTAYSVSRMTINPRQKDSGHQYILHADGGVNLVTYTADRFREFGFSNDDVDLWKQDGKTAFSPPVKVWAKLGKNSKGEPAWDVKKVEQRITELAQI